ncbi:hypothetical protein [Paracoccus mutanolyticus]|uniref:hypothetical protein n=1 Tax=Paracoccus mutanolyticus TaxID=1499308 RepID=UPI001CB89E68|nr:hypothetical protein [Paracoccus mutanolyticus]
MLVALQCRGIHQELLLMNSMTVAENIWIRREPRGAFGLVDHGRMNRQTQELFDRLNIRLDPAAIVSTAAACRFAAAYGIFSAGALGRHVIRLVSARKPESTWWCSLDLSPLENGAFTCRRNRSDTEADLIGLA